MMRRLAGDPLGTLWFVFGGCGSAILGAAFPHLGVGSVGVALACGVYLLAMAYLHGHISGAYSNSAITVWLYIGNRFPENGVIPHIVAQVIGGLIAGGVLYLISTGKPGFAVSASGFASNGYGEHSPAGYSMQAAILMEAVLSGGLLIVVLGVRDRRAPTGLRLWG